MPSLRIRPSSEESRQELSCALAARPEIVQGSSGDLIVLSSPSWELLDSLLQLIDSASGRYDVNIENGAQDASWLSLDAAEQIDSATSAGNSFGDCDPWITDEAFGQLFCSYRSYDCQRSGPKVSLTLYVGDGTSHSTDVVTRPGQLLTRRFATAADGPLSHYFITSVIWNDRDPLDKPCTYRCDLIRTWSLPLALEVEKQLLSPVTDWQPGDHVFALTNAVPGSKLCSITHHGIYEGGGNVIHFSGSALSVLGSLLRLSPSLADVHQSPLQTLAHQQFQLFRWPHEYGSQADRQRIVERARSLLGFRSYRPFVRNCEHFAHFCVSGQAICSQTGVADADSQFIAHIRDQANNLVQKEFKWREDCPPPAVLDAQLPTRRGVCGPVLKITLDIDFAAERAAAAPLLRS